MKKEDMDNGKRDSAISVSGCTKDRITSFSINLYLCSAIVE